MDARDLMIPQTHLDRGALTGGREQIERGLVRTACGSWYPYTAVAASAGTFRAAANVCAYCRARLNAVEKERLWQKTS